MAAYAGSNVKLIHLRTDSIEKIAQVVNERVGPRAYFPAQKKMVYADGSSVTIGVPYVDRIVTHPAVKGFL